MSSRSQSNRYGLMTRTFGRTFPSTLRYLLLLLVMSVGATLPVRAARLNLSAYKGKVVYLDFWASWCKPCRESFPWMNAIEDNYRDRGLVVIAVNLDHDRGLAQDFLQQNPADFKIVYDPGGTLAEKYKVGAMPTSVLIGRDGKIRFVHSGFHPDREREYLNHIGALLREKAS